MKRNARKQEFARKEMSLYEKEMVIRIQRCIGVMYREERRQFALPIQQFLIEFEYGGVIGWPNSKCCIGTFRKLLRLHSDLKDRSYYDQIFCP